MEIAVTFDKAQIPDGQAMALSLSPRPAREADLRGRSSEVERQLPKLNVAGSNPVSRSTFPLHDPERGSVRGSPPDQLCLGVVQPGLDVAKSSGTLDRLATPTPRRSSASAKWPRGYAGRSSELATRWRRTSMDSSAGGGEGTELETSLRVTSDSFLTRVERLHALEEQKRELPADEIVAMADEVESLAREILDWAVKQAELARTVASTEPGTSRPIAIIPPRQLSIVLGEWRASERVLDGQEPGTAAWESARADVERLREEYARAYRARMTRQGD